VHRDREHYRLVRVAGPNELEVLEWVTAIDSMPHSAPREVVTFGPLRKVFHREEGLKFDDRDAPAPQAIWFAPGRRGLEMPHGEVDACDGLGGEYVLTRDDEFGVARPSFRCDRAKQPREQAICASAELSMLDWHLKLAFQAAQERAKDAAARQKLQSEQSAWWAAELAKCQAGDCVGPLYRTRIAALEKWGK
jgi:uncharacterized protein YecT (DUF1311 family)